jgi:hypothetical protein
MESSTALTLTLTEEPRSEEPVRSSQLQECLGHMRRLEKLHPERWHEHLRRLPKGPRPIVEAYLRRNRERRGQFLRVLLASEGRPCRPQDGLDSTSRRTSDLSP